MNILVAVDCRDEIHPGLAMLLTRSWTADTVIRLVTVTDHSDSLGDFFGVKDPSNFFVAEQIRLDKKLGFLSQVSQQIRSLLPNAIFEERVLSGHVKEELISHAERWPADLVVVGSHHSKFIEFVLLGSVTQTILEHAPCPVHIGRVTEHRPGSGENLRILAALDYSAHSYAIVDWLLRQNFQPPFKIRLFTVLPPFQSDFAHEKDPEIANKMLTRIQEAKGNAFTRLNQLAEKMEQQLGKGLVECEVQEGSAKDAILREAKNWSAHLVVVGSHGRTGLTRFLLGSVSKAVATHAKCSVEVVRPPQLEIPPEPEPEKIDEQKRDDEWDRMPHAIIPH